MQTTKRSAIRYTRKSDCISEQQIENAKWHISYGMCFECERKLTNVLASYDVIYGRLRCSYLTAAVNSALHSDEVTLILICVRIYCIIVDLCDINE